MDMLLTTEFWIAVGQIIMIDILLGGDNAVVIALACRRLPPAQRTKGILWGTAGAIVLRIVLIFFALQLLAIPFLKVAGALLLLWIGVKLLTPDHEDGHANIEGSDRLWGAIKTVIVADFVMSLDNVIAIAGAAESAGGGHSMALVIFGVLISIPIIVWGSQMVIRLMDRMPIIITLGGMLLGWIAGTMVVTDPALISKEVMPSLPKIDSSDTIRYAAGIAGALLVLALGKLLAQRRGDAPASEAKTASQTPAANGLLTRVLVPVDGSDLSLKAVDQVLALRTELKEGHSMELHLLNVQLPVSGEVSSFVQRGTIQEYYQERSQEALAKALESLEQRGISCTQHHRVGSPGLVIAELAAALSCGLIALGTRGHGSSKAAFLGSVAQSTLEHATTPVLLVK